MNLTYDPDADAAFIYLVERIGAGQATRSLMCDLEIRLGAVIPVLDRDDHLLGIEVLGASRLLSEAVLATASLPTRE